MENLKDKKLKVLLGNTVLVYELAKRKKATIITSNKQPDEGYERVEQYVTQTGEKCTSSLSIGDKIVFNRYSEPDAIYQIDKYEKDGFEYVQTLFIYNTDKILAVE
jgi:co-chaperonin GroES (HSP10)